MGAIPPVTVHKVMFTQSGDNAVPKTVPSISVHIMKKMQEMTNYHRHTSSCVTKPTLRHWLLG